MAALQTAQNDCDQTTEWDAGDSGYGSPSNSAPSGLPVAPIRTIAEVLEEFEPSHSIQSTAEPPTAGLTTVNGMRVVHGEVDKHTRDRFNDIYDRLRGPLLEYLRKRRVEYRPPAIKLMVLGHNEQAAKPWIVVLCPKGVKKRVIRFFQKDLAKRLCQAIDPHYADFEVAVVGQPPKPKGAEDLDQVLCESRPPDPEYYRMPLIKVSRFGRDRIATMGGFVQVSDTQGGNSIYGLTAGHLLALSLADDETELSPYNTDDDDDSVSDSSDEEPSSEGSEQDTEAYYVELEASALQWSTLGNMSSASYSRRARNRDWALVELNETHTGNQEVQNEMAVPTFEAAFPEGNTSVKVHNHPPKFGRLSGLPAFAILPSGYEFVRVHNLTLDKGTMLSEGLSGSWIIHAETSPRNAYGILVADDIFGDVYMVSMIDILADIKVELNATEVTMPMCNPASLQDRQLEKTEPKSVQKPDDLEDREVSHHSSILSKERPVTSKRNPTTKSESAKAKKRPLDATTPYTSGHDRYVVDGAVRIGEKLETHRWFCCQCNGENSCDHDAGCSDCYNHWRGHGDCRCTTYIFHG